MFWDGLDFGFDASAPLVCWFCTFLCLCFLLFLVPRFAVLFAGLICVAAFVGFWVCGFVTLGFPGFCFVCCLLDLLRT